MECGEEVPFAGSRNHLNLQDFSAEVMGDLRCERSDVSDVDAVLMHDIFDSLAIHYENSSTVQHLRQCSYVILFHFLARIRQLKLALLIDLITDFAEHHIRKRCPI